MKSVVTTAFLTHGATIINRAIEQTDHKVQAFRKVADNFEATMGEVARALASASGGLGDSATSIDAEARDTGSQAQIATSSTHEAAESVERVAAATEELSASVNAIREQVSRSAAVTAEISNAVGETHGTMEELKGAAERIGRFITLIADLASQTNLLALNATIEAARAGEFGKGFAVVAAEVKMLADTTAKATDDIRREVEGIQASTQDAVGKFTRIAETMAHVEESSGAIAASIEEQAVATNEIASSVAIVSGGMRQVSGTVDRVSQAAEATQMAVEAVKAAADEIASRSTRLTGEVDTFLGQVRAVA